MNTPCARRGGALLREHDILVEMLLLMLDILQGKGILALFLEYGGATVSTEGWKRRLHVEVDRLAS